MSLKIFLDHSYIDYFHFSSQSSLLYTEHEVAPSDFDEQSAIMLFNIATKQEKLWLFSQYVKLKTTTKVIEWCVRQNETIFKTLFILHDNYVNFCRLSSSMVSKFSISSYSIPFYSVLFHDGLHIEQIHSPIWEVFNGFSAARCRKFSDRSSIESYDFSIVLHENKSSKKLKYFSNFKTIFEDFKILMLMIEKITQTST